MQARIFAMAAWIGLLGCGDGIRPLNVDDSGDADTDADTDSDTDTDTDVDADGVGLLSLNLHCLKNDGTAFTSTADRLGAVAAFVADADVDVLALQEVCVADGGDDALSLLMQALESETGQSWSSAWATAHLAWEGTPDEALEGLALVARGSLSGVDEVTYRDQADLQRVGLAATLPDSMLGLRVHAVHLEVADAGVRTAQAREAAATALVGAPSLDVVVAGDLNAVAGSGAHDAFLDMGFVDHAAALDSGRIDHVLAHRGADVTAVESRMVLDGTDGPVVSDHPGVLVRFEAGAGDDVDVTGIDVRADVGFGRSVYVRGDTAPLSWELGWPATNVAADHWRLVLTELPAGSFAFKALIDDTDWQTGDDAVGTVGTDNEVVPSF